jgi:4-alpha-glucanotransferase
VISPFEGAHATNMASRAQPIIPPPFHPGYRASAVLLHPTCLPSPYGIGDLGPSAFAWVDLLQQAGQSWWQALPLAPTGYGDSPYQPLSSFAGNGLLISPDILVAQGLLDPDVCRNCSFPSAHVDYGAVIEFKNQLLEQAWQRFEAGRADELGPGYGQFCRRHATWLEDYALFRALKERFHGAHFRDWPSEFVRRAPLAIARARNELSKQMDKIRFAQFLLFRQAQALKEYAHARGVGLIGDLPFFVSADSSDVWAHPQLFLVDEDYRPSFVAGAPPDDFTAEGQLWGNPVYDWSANQRAGFRFHLDRLRALLTFVDTVRLDHFRAFAAAWHIPADSITAQVGYWEPGPGADFFKVVEKELGSLPFIAEDLGVITHDVCAIRDRFGMPGTRVLQFAFNGDPRNPHLPENFSFNTVVYTGTHDNDTTRGWFKTLPQSDQNRVWAYLNRKNGNGSEISSELLDLAWSSVAALAIAPMQDLLNLGSEARMNRPGSVETNWRWRLTEDMLDPSIFQRLEELTRASNRLSAAHRPIMARSLGTDEAGGRTVY